MPSRSRIGLCAPSAAIRYRARTVRRARRRAAGRRPSHRRRPARPRRPRTRTDRGSQTLGGSSRTGSSPICVTKRRGDGLISSTPSLMKRKYQSSSFPPRLSTDTIAPFWTNSRPRRPRCRPGADRAVRLDRALVDESSPRVDRRAAMPLENERRHAVMTEEDRGRQPDEAAADDQNGNVFVRHLASRAEFLSKRPTGLTLFARGRRCRRRRARTPAAPER